MKILVIGGYGGFGARLSRRLAAQDHQVTIAGRSLAKATAFAATLANTTACVVDRNADLGPVLTTVRPDIVIDAAGPFQQSGYAVAEACIAAGAAYLDLADARDFVCNIGELDAAARAGNVAVIAGASSVPALSGAVVRELSRGMTHVSAIEIAISASSRAAAGPAVAAAILGNVGQPLELWAGGRWQRHYGWQSLRTERFAVSGKAPVTGRRVALADVPDLALLPARVPGHPAVSFRAGTESTLANLTLWMASWKVRWRWIASLAPLAPMLLPLQKLTQLWGGDRSGMIVRVFGLAAGARVERRWTLIAERDDGPEIPTLAAALLVERLARRALAAGSRDAGEALTLDEFRPLLGALAVVHETVELPFGEPLYRRVMGQGFDALAPAVRAMHQVIRDGGAAGEAVVARGANPIARLIAWAMRFPVAGEHALHVHFEEADGVERWTRDFGGRRFASELSEAHGELVERFGPLRFRFALPVADGGLTMVMTGWSLWRVPLPFALAPRSVAREWEAGGRFHFDVPIDLSLIGRIVHYSGSLELL